MRGRRGEERRIIYWYESWDYGFVTCTLLQRVVNVVTGRDSCPPRSVVGCDVLVDNGSWERVGVHI